MHLPVFILFQVLHAINVPQKCDLNVIFSFHRSGNGKDERKRPVSAAESTSSQESEFLGGRRMEILLDGLYHEKKAGGFFMKYLENLGNQVTSLMFSMFYNTWCI